MLLANKISLKEPVKWVPLKTLFVGLTNFRTCSFGGRTHDLNFLNVEATQKLN